MKKIICLIMASMLILSSFSVAFAETNSTSFQSKPIEVHNYNDTSEENIEPYSIIPQVVYLTMWVSHFNYHKSYTKTVTRRGKRYKVTYKAAPRSECKYCELISY